MNHVDCPSCGTTNEAGAAECLRCGRRLLWGSSPALTAQEPGTLFGEEPATGESPWGAPEIALSYEVDRLEDAGVAARRTLLAALVGLVATFAFVQVFLAEQAPPPDPNSSEYHVASVVWGSTNLALSVARLVVALFAASLAGYALVRGITSQTLLRQFGEAALARRAVVAACIGGAELLVMLATLVAAF